MTALSTLSTMILVSLHVEPAVHQNELHCQRFRESRLVFSNADDNVQLLQRLVSNNVDNLLT